MSRKYRCSTPSSRRWKAIVSELAGLQCSFILSHLVLTNAKVVQAPNSLLNTLFILNQRRSSGLADPIELKLRFGTPASLIEELKARMVDFVLENKRDYLPRVISEVRTIDEVYSVTLNVIFFHKSNFQNELLRLQRHNKFAEHLMAQMADLGIEGPRKHQPGGAQDFPFFFQATNPPSYAEGTRNGAAGGPFPSAATAGPEAAHKPSMSSLRETASHSSAAHGGIPPVSPDVARRNRQRAESRAARQQMESRLMDFGDVFEGRRDPAAVNLARLQSLREEAALSHASSVERSPGLAPLGRAGTMDSGSTQRRRGLFGGRPRSSTNQREGRDVRDARSDAGGSIV